MTTLYRAINSHVRNFEDQLYTSLPAVVTSYDPLEQTVNAILSVNRVDNDGVRSTQGSLERVPLKYEGTNDSSLTFPVKVGDKVIIHFFQSNVDNFFIQNKDEFKSTVDPRTKRKHDINDCYATLSLRGYDHSSVKRQDAVDLYYKDTRITISDDGKLELELVKTDGNEENPQVQHTQKIEINPSGDTKINLIKDTIDSEINILNTGEINAKNNKESSNLTLKANGDISGVTKSKFSIENDTVELVTALSDLAQLLIEATTNTYYGAMPLNNKSAIQALKTKIDSLKV